MIPFLNIVGWILYAYLIVAMSLGPEPARSGFWNRVLWSLQNSTWVFWVLMAFATICISIKDAT